jgi:hypothetical protein
MNFTSIDNVVGSGTENWYFQHLPPTTLSPPPLTDNPTKLFQRVVYTLPSVGESIATRRNIYILV